ncbi:MAG: hypothetical protein ACO1TE_13055 [Prosthecobacter sp.]
MKSFSSPSVVFVLLALGLGAAASRLPAAEVVPTLHYYDEVGFRHLTLQPLNGGSQMEVRVRWASDPGGSGVWLGQGTRKDGQIVFAAVVEEGQDRGTYFVAKGEGKLEIEYKPGQKMPQDPGILGAYRRVSDEKRLQLTRKEFQAAEDRLAATLKTVRTTWPSEDKAVAADWKARWPALRERWMKIAYQPPAPSKPEPKPALMPPTKERPAAEADVDYWLKLAQTTAMGYYFMQQIPDGKSQGTWAGDYNDGFGGSVSIRTSPDGRLRVSLNCTRGNELQGADLQGAVPPEAVKARKGAEPATAEAVFEEPNVVEAAKDVRVILKRKGAFLWVETQRKQEPAGRLAWFDGIYIWMPVPTE